MAALSPMTPRSKLLGGLVLAVCLAVAAGMAGAASSDPSPGPSPSGQAETTGSPDVGRAAEAARAHLGSGEVTGVEVEDGESPVRYEVELRTPDRREHEVLLDGDYQVLWTEVDDD